jgi:peptide/nickel transport system substrate-binding protein
MLLAACSGSGGNPSQSSGASTPAASTPAQGGSSSAPAGSTTGGSGSTAGGSSDASGAESPSSAPSQTEQAKNGGDLVIAGYQEMTTLDKDLAGTSNDALRVLENVLDRLYVLDNKAVPQPSLATGYTLSDDKLTWTFTLRKGATFSDGKPVTAKDVVFSLDLARKGDYLGSLYSNITDVSAQGDDTVIIKTKAAEPVMLQLMTLETSGVIEDNYGGKSKDDYYKQPIGSGPWMFASVTQGVGVKVVPNPHWWGEKGHLDSITFNTVADPNTRLIQLRSGQAQLIETPEFSQLDSINTGNTTVATFPSTEVDFLVMNTTKAPFDDVHFRRAISLAMDRQSIVQASLRGKGSPAATWVSASVLGGYEPADGTKFDLQAAKAELAKSKTPTWTQPIVLQYTKSAASGWPQAAQVIQANLQALGLTAKIETVDTNTIQAATTNKTFDLHFGLLTYDIPDAGELIGYYFATDGYNSFVDMTSSQKLNEEAAAEFDPAKRLEGFKTVADNIVNVDASTPGMYTVPYYWGALKSLHGFHVILTGQFTFNDLWLG